MVAVTSETTKPDQTLTAFQTTKKPLRKPKLATEVNRPAIEPLKNYPRPEAARVVPCAVITLIRAYEAGHLSAYRVGRKILHSGQHLIAWLEAGGRTGRIETVIGEGANR